MAARREEVRRDVIRRVGGLETSASRPTDKDQVIRRVGGLESSGRADSRAG